MEKIYRIKMVENYKLYETLQTLDKKEVRQFKRVLQSPFFVLRKDVNDLFDCLIKYHLKGKPFPPKEVVFKKVFPQKEFDYTQLRGTMSDLFELLEEYLLIKKRRSDKIKTRHLLAEIYRERKLSKNYQTVVKKTATLLEKQPLRNEYYYRNLLEFQLEETSLKVKDQRTKFFNLGEISDTIDTVFLVQKLKHSCTQLMHQQVYKTEYDFGLLLHLLPIIEQEKYLKIPAVAIYYYCYGFLSKQKGEAFFQKFKTTLLQNKEMFDVSEMKELYLYVINFCIRKLNEGDKKYSREILEWYQDGLRSDYFLENEKLSRFTYNNIVAAGILLKEFDWLEKFISTYAEKLDPAYRDSTVSFNSARVEYSRGNYAEVMTHLQNVEFKDLVNNLIAKTMLMKVYYELEEYDLLFSHLDSFQIYIRRREVSDFHRKNFMSIIRFLKKIVGLAEMDKKGRKALRKEIEAEEVLTEREWLLSKV